ncbi:universal stress protein [Natrinema soli]|uniref:Universal stress protein n=1 Tax=Natrinema soli TaxID=1930624 RepID=A0ABD5SHD1_9EURY|nr:universal stress protein [Natrinema soli]
MVRNILVPVDHSSQSTKALEYALQEYSDDNLTVLHVIDVNQIAMYGDEGYRFNEEYIQQLRNRAEELLERTRQTAVDHGTVIETELETGLPIQTIHEYIDENDIDHVVMGSHGRSGASRILLGSVAEAVTRRSPVPVTIVR